MLSRRISLTELTESVNEGWSVTDSITPVRPQPDFSVGFRREAFTEEQLAKIRPILGNSQSQVSRFRATWYMYFPFLACEVKCGNAALDIADRQNAHNMGIAVRAMVDLFELVGRRQEVERQILAYSVSHDDRCVRIYGYYSIFQADKVTYHRHLVHSIDIQAGEGKDKWTTYRFIKSIYQTWAPIRLQRIRAILDELPADITGLVSPPSLSTGLSQQIDASRISSDDTQSPEELGDDVNQEAEVPQPPTPDTSISIRKVIDPPKAAPNRRASSKKRNC